MTRLEPGRPDPLRMTPQSAHRVKREAPRKLIHLGSIVIPLGILHLPASTSRRGLLLALLVLLLVDMVRLHHPSVRAYSRRFVGNLLRRHEEGDLLASTYMVASALLATFLFPPRVAAAAFIFLVVGDALAALVGKAIGRTKIFGKSLEGFAAGFLASWGVGYALVPSLGVGPLAAGAFVAMVVEILPIPVDDNFRIPLLAGVVLQWFT